ncbi:MAG TPA: hypothetical protein VFF94_12885, partial [Novosphingobium sp.]|nr:hypothetical protein [Novosphingobium sp.]
MRLADSPYSDPLHGSGSFRQQTDLRNRLRAIALTLAIMALFAAGLVGLGVVSADRPGNGHNLVSMSFSADSNSQKAQHKSHQPTPKTQQSTAQ